MSDTPRTDAEEFYPHDSKYKVCDADFARKLERELNAANERIKRLEQLGDALANVIDESCDPTFANDVTRWRKNKEAKL